MKISLKYIGNLANFYLKSKNYELKAWYMKKKINKNKKKVSVLNWCLKDIIIITFLFVFSVLFSLLHEAWNLFLHSTWKLVMFSLILGYFYLRIILFFDSPDFVIKFDSASYLSDPFWYYFFIWLLKRFWFCQ